jgi:hypothetical protein
MKTIVITGATNKGKTSVLHLVYEKLILAGTGKGTKFEQFGAKTQRDFFDIVTYNKKKIAVYTMGDFPNCVSEAVEKATSAQCDMLICACNDKYFSGITTKPDHVIQKTIASPLFPFFEANLYDCYRILALIEWET